MDTNEFRKLIDTYSKELELYDEYTDDDFDIMTDYISEYLQELRFNFETDKFSIRHFDSEYGDGDGSEMYEVYEVTDRYSGEKEYFKFSGQRSSWDSSEYDSLTKVIPIAYTAYNYKDIK